jgi:hypothetical protein
LIFNHHPKIPFFFALQKLAASLSASFCNIYCPLVEPHSRF